MLISVHLNPAARQSNQYVDLFESIPSCLLDREKFICAANLTYIPICNGENDSNKHHDWRLKLSLLPPIGLASLM